MRRPSIFRSLSEGLSGYSPRGYWELTRTVVPVTRFDSICEVTDTIGGLLASTELVVKMDVEGYDCIALRGMLLLTRSQRALFMIEYSGDPRVDELFTGSGFAILDYSSHMNRNRGPNDSVRKDLV